MTLFSPPSDFCSLFLFRQWPGLKGPGDIFCGLDLKDQNVIMEEFSLPAGVSKR